jgi:hypothetical protein
VFAVTDSSENPRLKPISTGQSVGTTASEPDGTSMTSPLWYLIVIPSDIGRSTATYVLCDEQWNVTAVGQSW